MGKEIRAVNPQTKVVYRFVGKEIFIKATNLQYSTSIIAQIEAKGGRVERGRSWLKCDLFGDKTHFNLGGEFIDLTIDTGVEVEDKLCNFFLKTLESAKFICEVKDI